MADRFINIAHPDGRNFAVRPKDFERNRDGQYDGFTAGSYEDGSPYEPPAAKPDKPAESKKASE